MFRTIFLAVVLSTTGLAPASAQSPGGPQVQYAVLIWQHGGWHPYATFSNYLDASRAVMNLDSSGWDAKMVTVRR